MQSGAQHCRILIIAHYPIGKPLGHRDPLVNPSDALPEGNGACGKETGVVPVSGEAFLFFSYFLNILLGLRCRRVLRAQSAPWEETGEQGRSIGLAKTSFEFCAYGCGVSGTVAASGNEKIAGDK